MIASTLFLLSLTLERQKAGLSPRQLLIKALLFSFPLAISLWCRTPPSLLPSLPLYGVATLLFLLALEGEGGDIQEVDAPSSDRYIPPSGKGRAKRGLYHPSSSVRSVAPSPPILPSATLRPFTRPTGEIRFMALEVDKGEIWKLQEWLTGGPVPDQGP